MIRMVQCADKFSFLLCCVICCFLFHKCLPGNLLLETHSATGVDAMRIRSKVHISDIYPPFLVFYSLFRLTLSFSFQEQLCLPLPEKLFLPNKFDFHVSCKKDVFFPF